MMTDEKLGFVSEELEQYCIEHSAVISPHRQRIEEYTRKNVPASVMLTGALEGDFLQFMCRLAGARRVLEFGTYTGYSALSLAEALPADGEVYTLDIDERNTSIAREFWAQSPHGKKIHLVLGPASQTLKKVPGNFDLVFIDADKENYGLYLDEALQRLNPNGLIVADNCLFSGEVLSPLTASINGKAIYAFNEKVRTDPSLDVVLLPVRDGIYLIRKKS